MTLTITQVPYTGPYSNDKTKMDHFGPTVEALKRAMARLDYMAWKGTEFTQNWPKDGAFDKGFRKWQQDNEIPADGVYGQQTWKEMRSEKVKSGPHKGEYALDKYAQELIRKDWEAKNVPDETDIRAAITAFCLKAESNEDNWHYRLARPLDVSVDPLASYIVSDCSMYCIQAYHYAKRVTGLNVPDPSKQNYTGYGNTDYHEDEHPKVTAPYRVGDLAHYTGHVGICRRGGDSVTSIWSHHGSESGPGPRSLLGAHWSPLRFVVRPPLK